MKKIYIVMESYGQYEDRIESPVKAFTDKNKAKAFVEEKQKYYDELDEKYSAIDIDIQEKMTQLFNRYLKDTDKEMYDAYLKAIDLDVEAMNFNWDEYYEKELDFHDNSELVNKYMDICKLTDFIIWNISYRSIKVYVFLNPIQIIRENIYCWGDHSTT